MPTPAVPPAVPLGRPLITRRSPEVLEERRRLLAARQARDYAARTEAPHRVSRNIEDACLGRRQRTAHTVEDLAEWRRAGLPFARVVALIEADADDLKRAAWRLWGASSAASSSAPHPSAPAGALAQAA